MLHKKFEDRHNSHHPVSPPKNDPSSKQIIWKNVQLVKSTKFNQRFSSQRAVTESKNARRVVYQTKR